MSSPKVDLVISMVKNLIRSGDLQPGTKLPKEAEFAAQLGVSRSSLREAVRAMQAMNILEARQGDGTYVSSLDPADMIEMLSFAVDVSGPQSVVWFLEVRRIMEIHAAKTAAASRSEAVLAKLRACHEHTLKESDPEKLIELDTEFHLIIAETSDNPVLKSLLKVVSAPTLRARIWRNRVADQDFNKLREEHGAILQAIEQQNVDAAQFAMWAHVSDVKNWVEHNPEKLTATSAE